VRRHAWLVAAGAVALALGFAPKLWADLAPGPNDAPRETRDQRLRQRLEHLRDRAAGLASGFPHALPSAAAAPSSSAGPANLADELARKWAERVATRQERREHHQAELAREIGAHLNDPEIQAELKLHATRLADLARVEFLAQNARRGPDREKLLARVTRLFAREGGRHHARMAKLLAQPSAPAVSATPPAAPAPSAKAEH